MPSFTFGPNQLYITIFAALLFGLICIILWKYQKELEITNEQKRKALVNSGFLIALLTGIVVFFTSQEQGADPRTILNRTDPPAVEMTPRSVIEETNSQRAAERRQARRAESQSKTEELESDSTSLFDKLMEQEQAQRKRESETDK